MELNPGEQRTFNALLDTIRSVYEQNGFIPMDQPVVDRTDALLANVGGDTTKELIRIERDDDKTQALRFDLTVPLSRYVVDKYGELTFPFRRYAIGKVYRGERPQAGRFREFYQCDVDIIGNETLSVRHDAEAILMIAQLFTKLGLGTFKIRWNNRKLINGLFESLAIKNPTEVLRIIDKKEKLSEVELVTLFEKEGLVEKQIEGVLEFINSTPEDVAAFSAINVRNETWDEGVSEWLKVISVIEQSSLPRELFEFTPSIARGLDYYTGTVFETELVDYPEIGSVCSGGRYDDLASAFTTRKLPGVGMSIGLSRLFDQLMKKAILKPSEQKTNSRVVIIPLSDSEMSAALQLQSQLHQSNIACEISFAESKLDKRMSYANKLGIPYVVLIGEDEATSGSYTLRDMSDGSEQKLSPDNIVTELQK